MPIQPPNSPLWQAILAVKSQDEVWPPDNEDVAHTLAQHWTTAANTASQTGSEIQRTGQQTTQSWQDTAGTAAQGKAGEIANNFVQLSTNMSQLGNRAKSYGDTLQLAKNNIDNTVAANDAAFNSLQLVPVVGPIAAKSMAADVANGIVAMLSGMAGRIGQANASIPPGEPEKEIGNDLDDPVGEWPADLGAIGERALSDLEGGFTSALGEGTGQFLRTGADYASWELDHAPWLLAAGGDERPDAAAYEEARMTKGVDAIEDTLTELGADNRADLYNSARELDHRNPAFPIYLDPNRYPASAEHIKEAQNGTSWTGDTSYDKAQPEVLTKDPVGKTGRRAEALQGIPPHYKEDGTDRDEYPLAMSSEGGNGSSVKYIPAPDNRGSGAYIGNMTRRLDDGTKFRIYPNS